MSKVNDLFLVFAVNPLAVKLACMGEYIGFK